VATSSDRRPRLLVLNRSYWPDAEATGQLLTELCEDLATRFDVTVIAGQPNQNPEGADYQRTGWQERHGVRIRRVWNTRFTKSFLPGRAVNLISYLCAACWAALWAPRPDLVVVETDPPLLAFLGRLLQLWHRARLVVYLQDLYPDVAVALGKLREGFLARTLRRLLRAVYRRADRVVVLSRDMQSLLVAWGLDAEQIECLPNWIDTNLVRPCHGRNAFRARHQLDDRFVVMYSGNMGLCQRLEDVIVAAQRLADQRQVEFVLVGDGASRAALEQMARDLRLTQVRFLPYQPKGSLAESLSAADLHLLPVDPRVIACLMPSKLYGILAAGRPVLAVAPAGCELAEIVRHEGVGRVVTPGCPDELAAAIAWAVAHREELEAMGLAARRLAVDRYDRRTLTTQFAKMIDSVLGLGS
jgi:colanic acid biosynthesis glycosyl transferase WcaI